MDQTRTRREVLVGAAAVAVALAGCVGGGESDDEGSAEPETTQSTDTSGGWREAQLNDVTTGESFTIEEFDRPVIIHTFATWCPKCRGQQEEIKRYLGDAGDDAVAVDLTIDENDDAQKLREHADSNGFDWRFGIAPGDVTGAMVDEFGRSVASAPTSPVIIVCPDGSARAIGKGASADQIAASVDEHC